MSLLVISSIGASAITVTSVGSGPWNTPGTWDNGVPNPGDVVIIAGGDNVTLDVNTGALTSLTIDGTLTTTGAYTVDATTITVNGTYTNGSTGAITVTTMFVNGGATYDHAVNMANANTIPSATWS